MEDDLRSIGVVLWLLSAFCATVMGRDKGRLAKGLMLGLLLGPIGAIAATWMDRSAPSEARHRAEVERQLALYRNRYGLQATDHPGHRTNGHGPSTGVQRIGICPVCRGPLLERSRV